MDEISRYAVGIDIGTSNVRTVVASVNRDNSVNVIGYAEMPNSGMRRGMVANLVGPSAAIDEALLEAERMSGYQVGSAVVSVNGSQILSTRTEGMIAVGAVEHEINENDLARVQEVALQGKIPPNQKILSVIPLEFILDTQSDIKDPIGMTGQRLEMHANVVSTLMPNYDNICRVLEPLNVAPEQVIPSVMASARAVLTERQMENGVAVVDIGASTTGVAIYEANNLQYVGVIPIGSNNITNDLAVLLAIDTEIAEEIKRRFATGDFVSESDNPVVIRWRGKELHFERDQIDEAVEARLDEILDLVRKELKKAHYDRMLPEGIVLTGGGARIRDIDKFVRATLGMSVKIGVPSGLTGVAEAIEKPEYSAAVGLMLLSAEGNDQNISKKVKKKLKKGEKKPSLLARFFKKF